MSRALPRRRSAALYWLGGFVALTVFRHPLHGLAALAFAVALSALYQKSKRPLWGGLLLVLPVALLMPMFSHRGTTILFYIGYNPVTAETALNALLAAIQLYTALLWFWLLSAWADTAALLLSLRRLSPRLALASQIALRALPLLIRRGKTLRETAALRGQKNIMRQLSAWAAWNLEDGMEMALQLRARGYRETREGKTTTYQRRGFRLSDAALAAAAPVPAIAALWGVAPYSPFPTLTWPEPTAEVLAQLAVLCLYFALPFGMEAAWAIRRGRGGQR